MPRRGRGRPTGETGAREAIIGEARGQFASLGFRGTSLRGVAQAVGVDPRLVLHYFGSKRALFLESVELPMDPAEAIEGMFADGVEYVPQRATELLLAMLDEPRSSRALTGLVRAAVTEPEAAKLIRSILTDRLLLPIARRVGGGRPELRASLAASLVVGLVVVRNVVGIEALADAARDDLFRALVPVLDQYLRGDWVATPEAATAAEPGVGA